MAKAKAKKDASFESNDDDSLLINLEEVQEQSRDIVPKGTYDVTIDTCEYKLSQSSGKPMWNFQLTITDGEYAGRKLFTILSFSEKALPGTKGVLARIKPDLISSSFNPKAIAESGELVGLSARVKTKIEMYNGEEKTSVASWLAASSDSFA